MPLLFQPELSSTPKPPYQSRNLRPHRHSFTNTLALPSSRLHTGQLSRKLKHSRKSKPLLLSIKENSKKIKRQDERAEGGPASLRLERSSHSFLTRSLSSFASVWHCRSIQRKVWVRKSSSWTESDLTKRATGETLFWPQSVDKLTANQSDQAMNPHDPRPVTHNELKPPASLLPKQTRAPPPTHHHESPRPHVNRLNHLYSRYRTIHQETPRSGRPPHSLAINRPFLAKTKATNLARHTESSGPSSEPRADPTPTFPSTRNHLYSTTVKPQSAQPLNSLATPHVWPAGNCQWLRVCKYQ